MMRPSRLAAISRRPTSVASRKGARKLVPITLSKSDAEMSAAKSKHAKAGIVDEDVDRAERGFRLIERGRDACLIRYVERRWRRRVRRLPRFRS